MAEDAVPEKTVSSATWSILIGGLIFVGLGAWVIYRDPFRVRSDPPAPIGNSQVIAATQPEPPPPPPPTHHAPVFVTDTPASTSAVIASASAADPDAAKKAALDAAKKQVSIKVYSRANDAMTRDVHKFLTKRGYTYQDFDIDQSDTDRIEMNSLNPSGSIPTLVVDGAVVTQMDGDEINSALDKAAEARLAQSQKP